MVISNAVLARASMPGVCGYYPAGGASNGNDLVWRAATRTMNPTITEAYLAQEFERDCLFKQAHGLIVTIAREIQAHLNRICVSGAKEVTRIITLDVGLLRARRRARGGPTIVPTSARNSPGSSSTNRDHMASTGRSRADQASFMFDGTQHAGREPANVFWDLAPVSQH
ncbi:MAG: hypothetical protein WCC90_08115 [Methylocella sp.]